MSDIKYCRVSNISFQDLRERKGSRGWISRGESEAWRDAKVILATESYRRPKDATVYNVSEE